MTAPNASEWKLTITGSGEVRDSEGNLLNQESDEPKDDQ